LNPLYDEAVRLFSVQKPIVAAIQGPGGGSARAWALAVVADFRIASPDAQVSRPTSSTGLPSGLRLTHTLPRLIGPTKAQLMFLTGPSREGRGGPALGPGRRGRPAGRTCAARPRRLAKEIAENAPLAIVFDAQDSAWGSRAASAPQTDKEAHEQAWLRDTADYRKGRPVRRRAAVGNFSPVR